MERDTFHLPDEPVRRTAQSLAWPAIAIPIAMSLALFLMTRSPLSLVFVVFGPIAAVTSARVNRRRTQRQFTRDEDAFLLAVTELTERARRFHQDERALWLREHPDAFVLGWSEQPSAARCVGSARTERQRRVQHATEQNPDFPLALELRGGALPELTIAFRGVLARRLRNTAQQAGITVHEDRHRFPQDSSASHRYLERRAGGITLHSGGRLRVRLVSQRSLQSNAPKKSSDQSGTLCVTLGRFASGELVQLDLVSDGPHALIAGTTGSGKSELLRTLVVQLATTQTAQAVQLLLIDFKGGATFQPFADLPHTAQVLTDLEPELVQRTVTGLRAELRRRERVLRDHAVSDLADVPPQTRLPRLIILIDEFATLMHEFPDAHHAFTDVAARGRALGVHLIIATQRPAGVVRDALATNCALRFCLNVADAQESNAVLGSAQAASLSGLGAGACVHRARGAVSAPWTVHRADLSALQSLHTEAHASRAPVPPWLPPLPTVIDCTNWPALPADQVYLGLDDQPEHQRQERVIWKLREQPVLLILGSARSGKSALIASLSAQCSVAVRENTVITSAGRADEVWDALTALQRARAICEDSPPAVWLFDDLDAAWEQFGAEHAAQAAELLRTLIRRPPSGHALVFAMQRLPAALSQLFQPVEHRLFFRAASREQHLGWGLPLVSYSPTSPPGRGMFRGHAIHGWLHPSSAVQPSTERVERWVEELPSALVTESFALLSARNPDTLRSSAWLQLSEVWQQGSISALARLSASPMPSRVAGTIEEWSALLRHAPALRTGFSWLFEPSSPSEIRHIVGRAWTAPPVNTVDTLLAWHHERGFRRVTLAVEGSDTVSA